MGKWLWRQKYMTALMKNRISPNSQWPKLNDYTIQRVQSIKYLGLTIWHNLYHGHLIAISRIVSKVNQVQSFSREFCLNAQGTLKWNAIKQIFAQSLKYAAIVWSPHTQSDIHTVEMLQRKAARCVQTFFNISPVNMLGGDTLFTKALACDFWIWAQM